MQTFAAQEQESFPEKPALHPPKKLTFNPYGMKRYFPFLEWLPNYKREHLGGDLSAGLTVGVMLIPQGMAYAMLAGLPPIYGLYASTIPLIVYALMGTSRQLAVGPVAMVSLLIASGVGALAETGTDAYIAYAILLALMVGVLQFAMGAFRLGFLVNFLSHPVIAGFTSAAAVIIGISQLKHLLGMDIPGGKVHETLWYAVTHITDIQPIALLIGVISIALLVGLKKVSKKIPGPLMVVIFGIGVVTTFDWHEKGVSIVGDVPGGFNVFALPGIDFGAASVLMPIALTIAFIGFMESIAVAKSIQAKHKDYKVVPNQELMALGAANIVGAFFKAFPVTGGFSRTAVNDQSGAKTGLASVVSALLIILTLLFLTDLFYYLPNAVLAAIIMVAVAGLIDVREAVHLWKTDRQDLVLFSITALGTLALGIEEGILIGVVLSLGVVIYRISYPHIAILGRVPGTTQYRNILRFQDLEVDEDIFIFRVDAQMYFANTNYIREFLERELEKRPEVKYVVMNAGAITGIDSSAAHTLFDLVAELKVRGISMHIAEARGPVRDVLLRCGLQEHVGVSRFHLSVEDAVREIRSEEGPRPDPYALQTNKGTRFTQLTD